MEKWIYTTEAFVQYKESATVSHVVNEVNEVNDVPGVNGLMCGNETVLMQTALNLVSNPNTHSTETEF